MNTPLVTSSDMATCSKRFLRTRKKVSRTFFVVLLCTASLQLHAQYAGGSGQGISMKTTLSVSMSALNSMYSGGSNDGLSSYSASLISLSAPNTSYTGGSDDGFGSIAVAAMPFSTNSMYAGGSNDGVSSLSASLISLATPTMYAGGTDDGFHSLLAAALPLSTGGNYTGGANDGTGSITVNTLSLATPTMYAGGTDDGYGSISNPALSLATAGMFAGGGNDGYTSAFAPGLAIVVPVRFEEFTVKPVGADAYLVWKVSNETGTAYYKVERSFEGSYFSGLGNVPVLLMAGTHPTYNYTDIDPATFCPSGKCNIVYYRIRSVYQNGTEILSPIRQMNLGKAGATITIQPNPASDRISIRFNGLVAANSTYDLVLFNSEGKAVISESKVSGTSHDLFTRQLPNGSYFLKISRDNNIYQTTVIILH